MSSVDSDSSSVSSEINTKLQSENCSGSSDENSILEQLKKSLKISENEFLESEVADLKEFFTVELVEHEEYKESFSAFSSSLVEVDELNYERFWLKVGLPVTLRKITKDGKEIINERKAEVSFRIKLKNGKFVVKIENPGDEDNNKCSKKVPEKVEEEYVEEDEKKEQKNENVVVDINNNTNEQMEDAIPYDIEDFEIIGIEDEDLQEERVVLESILKELLEVDDLALLNMIEELYIRLEATNYPHKEIICRDYYYPIFDARHWGRPKSLPSSASKISGSTPLSSFSHANSSSLDLPGGTTLSYRARALYDFQALMQGELSFQENEILVVLANLGNGWLTARRSSDVGNVDNTATTDDNMTGLIPENYIERL